MLLNSKTENKKNPHQEFNQIPPGSFKLLSINYEPVERSLIFHFIQ